MVRSPTPGAFPRLRGKLDLLEPEDIFLGCIPAPAGETPVDHCGVPYPAVHPRACGGNQEVGAAAPLIPGASPRLRGKHVESDERALAPGCVPAPAGETPSRSGRPRCWSEHPRACGGNSWVPNEVRGQHGASPRLRGKRLPLRHRAGHPRCIPAPAGETTRARIPTTANSVHPRACGGNSSAGRRR